MDSSPHSDRLLELLYGELSEDEERALRREINSDEELADEWRQLRDARSEVWRQIPDPEPMPDEVRDSILEAARRGDEEKPRRGADAPRGDESIWRRATRSGTTQALVSAALVMLVGGGFLYHTGLLTGDGLQDQQADDLEVRSAATAYDGESVEAEAAELPEQPPAEGAEREAEQLAEEQAQSLPERTEAIADAVESEDLVIAGRTEEPEPRRRQARSPSPGAADSAPDLDLSAEDSFGGDSDSAGVGSLGLAGAGRGSGEGTRGGSATADSGDSFDDEDEGLVVEDELVLDETTDDDAEEQAEQETRDRAAAVGGLEAEADSPPPSTEEQNLTAARSAYQNEDYEEARRLVEWLFEDDRIDELDDDQAEEARDLRRMLDEREEEVESEAEPAQEDPALLHR